MPGGMSGGAAGELASGSKNNIRAEDAFVAPQRVVEWSGTAAAAGVVDAAEGEEILAPSENSAVISAIIG